MLTGCGSAKDASPQTDSRPQLSSSKLAGTDLCTAVSIDDVNRLYHLSVPAASAQCSSAPSVKGISLAGAQWINTAEDTDGEALALQISIDDVRQSGSFEQFAAISGATELDVNGRRAVYGPNQGLNIDESPYVLTVIYAGDTGQPNSPPAPRPGVLELASSVERAIFHPRASPPSQDTGQSAPDDSALRKIVDPREPSAMCGHMTARYLDEVAEGDHSALDVQKCKALTAGAGEDTERRQKILSVKIDGASAVVIAEEQDGADNDVIKRRFHFVKEADAWKIDYYEEYRSVDREWVFNCGSATDNEPSCR
jgi:hypothetical protein